MEFIEAPAFTRFLADYLKDDDFKEFQSKLAANPDLGELMRGRADFERYVGQTPGEAKAAEAGCELSITTSSPITKYG